MKALDTVMEEVDESLLSGMYDQAIELLDDASREEPSNYLIRQRLGDLYRSLERPDDAIEAYEQAIALAADNSDLWIRKGDALIDARSGEAAIDALERASSLAPSPFTEFDWNLRGDRCYGYQDYETASRLYEHGLAVRPNADGWRGLALIASASGRLDDAVGAYEEGLEIDPERADLMNDLGLAYREQGKLPEALEVFKKLVVVAPDSPSWWYNLGFVSRESEDFQAAREAYLHSVELSPDDADTWVELGLCELRLGQSEPELRQALRSFDRAIGLDETSFWAWNNAGWVLVELGEFGAAVERLDRAIDLDPNEISPWSNKVWALARSGEVERAEACASDMLNAVTDRAEALATKGRLLADWTVNSAEALELLREASDLRPDDPSIRLDIAEVTLKVGEHAESRKAARKLLALDLEEDHRCAMLFVVYAAYVLERSKSHKRREAFREFIDYFRSHFVTSPPKPLSWNYEGLALAIQREREVANDEEGFLLSMTIDLQVGTIDPNNASFFAGRPGASPNPP